MMDHLLRGVESFTAAYIDDLVIFSKTWEDHLQHIVIVLQKLRDAGLTCQFAMDQCSYLGHVVGNGVVKPEEHKVKAVKEFAVPQTKREVRTFLGLTGYYRRFIPNLCITTHRSNEESLF